MLTTPSLKILLDSLLILCRGIALIDRKFRESMCGTFEVTDTPEKEEYRFSPSNDDVDFSPTQLVVPSNTTPLIIGNMS